MKFRGEREFGRLPSIDEKVIVKGYDGIYVEGLVVTVTHCPDGNLIQGSEAKAIVVARG